MVGAFFDVYVMVQENRRVMSSLLLKQARAPSYFSRGVTVDPGTTLNSTGPWVEIQDATDEDISSFMLSASTNSSGNGTPRHWIFDVAIGSSGNEDNNIIIAGSFLWAANWGHCADDLNYFGIPIPAGSRISIRIKADDIDINRRTVAFSLTGLVT